MKKLISLLLAGFLLIGAKPAESAGLVNAYYSFSNGGYQVTRTTNCFITDDSLTTLYTGTLGVNQTFSIVFDWCSPDDITLGPNGYWEGVSEDINLTLTGREKFLVEVFENDVSIGAYSLPAKNGYENWQKCSTYHYRLSVTSPYGYTTFKVTNIGDRLARDINFLAVMVTDHNEWLQENCQRPDWGF